MDNIVLVNDDGKTIKIFAASGLEVVPYPLKTNKWRTLKSVAAELNISPEVLTKRCRQHRLNACKFRGQWLLSSAAYLILRDGYNDDAF